MPDIIRVGQTPYSWNSLNFTIADFPYQGLVSFDVEQKRERKVVFGQRRDGTPLGKTAGKYTVPTCNMKMLVDSYDALTTDLSVLGEGSYGDAEFSIIIQVFEPDLVTSSLPIVILCEGCTIDGEKDGFEEGVDEALVEVEIGCLQVTKNGKRLWSLKRGIL